MFFSREGELRAFKLLAERGFGPALLATLEDGRVEEFLEGKVRRSRLTRKADQHTYLAAAYTMVQVRVCNAVV